MEQRTEDIDLRLRLYFEDLLEHSSAKEDDDNDWHDLAPLKRLTEPMKGSLSTALNKKVTEVFTPKGTE